MTTIAILHGIHDALDNSLGSTVGLGAFIPFQAGVVQYPLGEAHDIDWERDVRHQHERISKGLAALVEANANAPIAYFGASPIPHAMHLGAEVARVAGWKGRQVFQCHHVSKDWRWLKTGLSEGNEPVVTGLPQDVVRVPGDVIVRVSTRNRIDPASTVAVVPEPLAEIDIALTVTGPDVLESEADLNRIADELGRAMDLVSKHRPEATVHLFAAVPVGLAFAVGLRLSPTQHRPCYVYQYHSTREPKYERALLINGPREADLQITAEERASLPLARTRFKEALEQVQGLADELASGPPTSSWWEDVTRGASVPLRRVGAVSARLQRCQSVVGAHVQPEAADDSIDGFGFDPGTRSWCFSDDLLVRFLRKFPGVELQRAARLFFLHEALHHDHHGLTGALSQRIGRFPKVVEDLDYEADLWSVLHAYRWARTFDKSAAAQVPRFFNESIDVLLRSFWAFDDRGTALEYMPVRRVNRYLIWYWQRLAVERVDSLEDALGILATKPVIELVGPRVRLVDDRVSFMLDPKHRDHPELALIAEGRLERLSGGDGNDLHALINGFRDRNDQAILRALRGAFDQLRVPAAVPSLAR